jgi:tetratricopeptide (TPR) repeat protein
MRRSEKGSNKNMTPKKESQNTEEAFHQLMRMIRIGFPLDNQGKPTGRKAHIKEAINALKKTATEQSFGEIDQLRLATLEAEFYQQCGKHLESERVLEPIWDRLWPEWNGPGPLRVTKDRRLLRQQVWALLHYVFYHHYHVTGQHKPALDAFVRIEKIVQLKLQSPGYCPFGTLALCNYFLGLCYRVNRGFVDAEQRMLVAQEYTYERVKRELKRTDISQERKQYEIDYKDLFSARILSGLGWISLQQGYLSRAEQHLRTAQNCLVGVRQETIGVWVDTLLSMAIRRRTACDSPDYEYCLEELERRYAEASETHELTRQRCAFELVRGYLDLAEFGGETSTNKNDCLREAQQWLATVRDLSSSKASQRYHLHMLRFQLVAGQGDAAEATLKELKKLVGHAVPPQRAALIMEAYLYFSQKDLEAARAAVDKALAQILPFSETDGVREYRVPDPVLEAECYVLLARICAAQNDYSGSRHYLDRWRLLSQFVENHYLHRLAKQIITDQLPFFLESQYPIFDGESGGVIMTIVKRVELFERWLIENAQMRYPEFGHRELANIYGMNRSTLSRKFGKILKKDKTEK